MRPPTQARGCICESPATSAARRPCLGFSQHRQGRGCIRNPAYMQLDGQPDRRVLIQTSVYTNIQNASDSRHRIDGSTAQRREGSRVQSPARVRRSGRTRVRNTHAARGNHSSRWIAIWPHRSLVSTPLSLIDPEAGGGRMKRSPADGASRRTALVPAAVSEVRCAAQITARAAAISHI